MSDFILPDIGEGIVECELLKWLVKEGESIVEDQAVAEVMTDKATVEIPAMHSGIVGKLYYQEGEIAKVHQPLFSMRSIDTEKDDSAIAPVNEKQTENDVGIATEAFVLPDIGEGIVECEIMQWHIQEGDTVHEDQVVVEVMTDKAVVEIPAKYNGKIAKIHYQKGDIAKVHTPLFDQYINVAATANNNESTNSVDPVDTTSNNQESKFSNENVPVSDSHLQGENFEAPYASNKNIASPAVRRLAREMNVNLADVKASGKKNRVLKQDILSYAGSKQKSQQGPQQVKHSTHDNNAKTTMNSRKVKEQGDKTVAIKGVQAAMAKQMLASVSTIPHFTVSDELCMDHLIELRKLLKPEFEKEGLSLSFMPFFIKALSLALKEYPVINSQLNADATELTYLSSHNIGLAVDSKIGLLVPNIKNVQDLSLYELTVELNRLIDLARLGKLTSNDLSGGTISVSNIGVLGGITATPIINKPEVAIVALGKTQKLPRFDDAGNVHASNIMTVSWSGDHRVIDGATMVKFNNLWLDYLSNPEKMLVHLR